jgi:hypothetical protein
MVDRFVRTRDTRFAERQLAHDLHEEEADQPRGQADRCASLMALRASLLLED